MPRNAVGLPLLLAAVSVAATAAQFRSFDLAEQVEGSDLIVVGTVGAVSASWSADGSALFTDSVVALDEVWKGGPPGDRITVRTPGGEADGLAFEVDGAATLTPGERVVLFLRERDGVFTPWGMRYGKYRVEDAGASGYVIGPLPPAVAGSAAHEVVSMTLEELRESVRRLAERR
ncbi:MAG: hypothetical protein ACREQY_12315 [Candidatus Binatia bacterium]